MKTFEVLSNNELMELRNLVNRITVLIDKDCCHVSYFLPAKLLIELGKTDAGIEYEISKREL